MKQKSILVLVNKQTTIVNFRLEVIDALVKAGYKVYVSVPYGGRLNEIEAIGAVIIKTQFEKNGKNPFKDFSLMLAYRKLIKETKADLVLTYTIKPNVYGGMAAASKGIPYVANITGLGTAVENGGLMQKLTLTLYRMGFAKISKVFFQNEDNRLFFENRKIAVGKHDSLPGSGVNLNKFDQMEYPADGNINFGFISRIMKEKGIEQYLDTARTIKEKYPNTRFHVAGFGDEGYERKMAQLHEEGLIIYHGLLKDVRVMLKDVHCVIHPTFYPEGMSNVLLESASSCRPIISTDRAGCREAIDNGVNGYLVKERDSNDLIEKVELFLALSYEEKKAMGINGRKKMQKEFDRDIVIQKYLNIVQDLIGIANL